MHCSTSCAFLPILPRGLALLVLLGLFLQTSAGVTPVARPVLPSLPILAGRWHPLARPRRRARRPEYRFAVGYVLVHQLPRLMARGALLGVLLHTSGWLAFHPWTGSVLWMPGLQMLGVLWTLGHPPRTHRVTLGRWSRSLQRFYQLTLVLLGLCSLLQFVSHLHAAPGGLFLPLGLTTWVAHPDADTEIRLTTTKENHHTVTLRGAFQFVWEPRDGFEKGMLILFVRRLQRLGDSTPLLSQDQVAAAFGSSQSYVSRWERLVTAQGWHVLSDRFRHALHSLLPDAELSQQILKVWVPAFWLSAWDVRERLIQLGVVPDRDALDREALHAVAHPTGFNLVRDVLLERFDRQGGRLIAREHWWLHKLLALNERLCAQLERGERLTPQASIESEPFRLRSAEKTADFAPPPLAAALHHALFDRPSEPPPVAAEPIRCTYGDSADTAPKSQTPRLKTVIDEFGEKQVMPVLRRYCKNPACPYQTFTQFPAGVLPHSPYAVPTRLLAVEVDVTLLSTYRRTARLFTLKAAAVYHWVASVSPAALCLAAYLGVVRTSGIVGLDDKWILVCSPSAVRPHGHRPRAVWRYAYFAVDMYSYDLLALELYPEHGDEAVRLFLLELKANGLRPRVVVSDLDPAYGRRLPKVFPDAEHHEGIFHAIQNALKQMTRVYGRYYLEKIPETTRLHEAITQLFQAHTHKTVQKRFAALMELQSSYVAKTPEIACVFDSLERHFPKLINAIESPDIPHTNNATELVIRRFDQHYPGMCGLDSFESAQVYLRLFELVYRLTPFMEDNPGAKRGKCPLELAGYDLKALPIADFFINLKLPALTIPAQPLSQ